MIYSKIVYWLATANISSVFGGTGGQKQVVTTYRVKINVTLHQMWWQLTANATHVANIFHGCR